MRKRTSKIPVIKNIHQKVYAAACSPGALDMDAWHTCKTTHCRAGRVVVLAGKEGRKLEKKLDKSSMSSMGGTYDAAIEIYEASGYIIDGNKFFDSDKNALADMKQLAEAEKAGTLK